MDCEAFFRAVERHLGGRYERPTRTTSGGQCVVDFFHPRIAERFGADGVGTQFNRSGVVWVPAADRLGVQLRAPAAHDGAVADALAVAPVAFDRTDHRGVPAPDGPLPASIASRPFPLVDRAVGQPVDGRRGWRRFPEYRPDEVLALPLDEHVPTGHRLQDVPDRTFPPVHEVRLCDDAFDIDLPARQGELYRGNPRRLTVQLPTHRGLSVRYGPSVIYVPPGKRRGWSDRCCNFPPFPSRGDPAVWMTRD